MRDDQREALQGQLVDVIVRVLIKNKQLHYYQVSKHYDLQKLPTKLPHWSKVVNSLVLTVNTIGN